MTDPIETILAHNLKTLIYAINNPLAYIQSVLNKVGSYIS